MANKEVRGFDGLTVEYRTDEQGNRSPLIRGTAVLFNSDSRDLGGFVERISPRAFDKFFTEERGCNGKCHDVACLWSHDTSKVLGRTPKTLKLKKDERGIHFELDPPKSMPHIVESVERADVRGASFAFSVSDGGDDWSTDNEGRSIRTVNDISGFYEVSLVLQPAYELTEVSVAQRSFDQFKAEREERRRELEAAYKRFKKFVAERRG